MKTILALFLTVLVFILWIGSIRKVDEWNDTKDAGHVELSDRIGSPGEPPTLLDKREGGKGTRNEEGMVFEIDQISIDEDQPVKLALRREGRFEVSLPATMDLEHSKELVQWIQYRIRTLITMPDGEILSHSGITENGWFLSDPFSSSAIFVMERRSAAGKGRLTASTRSDYTVTEDDSGNRVFSFDITPFLDTRRLALLDFNEVKDDYTISFRLSDPKEPIAIGEYRFSDLSEILEPHMLSTQTNG